MLVWRTKRTTIYKAAFATTLRKAAAAGGCDLVFMSPPYDDARTYGNAVSWKFGDYQSLGDESYGALKPGGQCLMVLDGPVREWRDGKGTERSFTPWQVMLDWAERIGFRVPDRLAYGRLGNPGRYEGRFRNDWEPLFWFQKPGGDGFFDKDPLSSKTRHGSMTKTSHSRKPDNTANIRQRSGEACRKGLKRRGTMWDYGSIGHLIQGTGEVRHPAPFPLPLAEDIVRCFSPPDGIVCDPFVGSGTSAVGAVKHGRSFIGGDLYDREDGVPWGRLAHERVSLVRESAGLLYRNKHGK